MNELIFTVVYTFLPIMCLLPILLIPIYLSELIKKIVAHEDYNKEKMHLLVSMLAIWYMLYINIIKM